jgi:glycosyltransferase involved in cell wall biosynthesis
MRGGVVDYSEELLPELAEQVAIEVYTRDGLTATNPAITRRLPVFGHSAFLARDRREPYDEVVYQLGSSPDHVPDYDCLLRRPGVVVLHELNLSGILGAKTLGRSDRLGYVREICRNEGWRAGLRVTWRILRHRRYPGPLEFSMDRVALLRASGLIVHNEYMRQQAQVRLAVLGRTTPVYRVAMGVPPAPAVVDEPVPELRRRLGLGTGDFVVGSFGIVHESKRLSVVLAAFRELLATIPQARYLLVGPPHSADEVRTVAAAGLGDRVRLTGHVNLHDFYRYVAASDLCLNLRYPGTGGSSAALLRLMSVGRPVVVTDHAQFAELPDDVCLKLAVGPAEAATLYQLMVAAVRDPARFAEIGRAARRYVASDHTLERSARQYREAILGQLAAGRRPRSWRRGGPA